MGLPHIIEDIEARVKDTGDVMTGSLRITSDGTQGVTLEGNTYGGFLIGQDGYLYISGDGRPLTIRTVIHDNVTNRDYSLYGEHNKPTAFDINALPFNRNGSANALAESWDDPNWGGCNVGFENRSPTLSTINKMVVWEKNSPLYRQFYDGNTWTTYTIREQKMWQSNIDLNTFVTNGIFETQGINANSPLGSDVDTHWHINVFSHNPDYWIRQIAYDVRSNYIYSRIKYNGSFQEWQNVIMASSSESGYIAPFVNGARSNQTYYWGFNGGASNTYAVHYNDMVVGSSNRLNKKGGNWFNASLGMNWYKYEQSDTSANQLPYPHVCILTTMESANRGFAIAGDWTSSRSGMWMNNLHDDTGSYKWGGWKRIWVEGNAVTGAVWNDYAECREADTIEPGYVLVETGNDTLTKSTERLSPFAGVSSDTWGFSQGETDKAKTPIAVAGRVLVYPWQDRNNYKPGDCVCAAPEGKVDIMTREEIIQYPDRIVGTVSSVPTYDKWGGGETADREPVDVNGRIWIKVR